MHDALALEDAGVPTAVVSNQAYVRPARAMARVLGAPDYQFVVLQTLLAALTAEEVALQAKQALPAVLDLLISRS